MIIKSPKCFQCFSVVHSTLCELESSQLLDWCVQNEQLHHYQFLQNQHHGLDISVVLMTYSPGNNHGSVYFIWKYDNSDPLETVFQNSLPVVELIKPILLQYHTCDAKVSSVKYSHVSSNIQCSVLQAFYKDLTGDRCAASNLDEESAADLDMEPKYLNTVLELRSLNSFTGRANVWCFWDHFSRVFEESVGTAVDDCRHGEVIPLAQAVSVIDFKDKVALWCPEETPGSSLEWLRL